MAGEKGAKKTGGKKGREKVGRKKGQEENRQEERAGKSWREKRAGEMGGKTCMSRVSPDTDPRSVGITRKLACVLNI